LVNKRPRGLTAIAEFSFLDVIPIDNLSAPTSTEVAKITLGEIVDNIAGDINVDSAGASTYNAGSIVAADINASADIALTQLISSTSAELAALISDETGSGLLVFGTSPTLITPALGTPSALVLTNATGLVDAGVDAGAAIATSKLADSANFILGDQNNDFNAFFQDVDGIAVPANPAAGHRRIFVDSADGILKVRTPGGTTVSLEGAGGGEANTASNVGTGVGVFDVKNGVDLEFNSLIGGTGIDISDTVQDLTIAIDSTVAVHSENLSVFAATTSTQLAGVISDETGSGALVFATSPTLVTPLLGTPTSGVLTNCTGLPEAGLLDNAVTLAKMAGGIDGNLITYDASGDPAFVATGDSGQILTSGGVGVAPTFQAAAGGGKTFAKVVKPDDETVNNSTTLQDDDDLTFTPTINKVYHYFLMLLKNSSSVADMDTAFSIPSGATMEWLGFGDTWSWQTQDPLTDATVEVKHSADGTNQMTSTYGRLIMGSTAGNVTLQWAQTAAEVSDTKVLKGSMLIVWEE